MYKHIAYGAWWWLRPERLGLPLTCWSPHKPLPGPVLRLDQFGPCQSGLSWGRKPHSRSASRLASPHQGPVLPGLPLRAIEPQVPR